MKKSCNDCEHCMYICEGDSICDINNKIILDDWTPTDEYFWCNGKKYKKI